MSKGADRREAVAIPGVTALDPLLEAWREAGSRYVHHGHEIFYRDAGGGRVVLCLHGFPTASWDWHRVWEPLAGEFRLIAPDLLGFGFSDKPVAHDYSVAEHADMIEGLLAARGIERIDLLAHDLGDTVGQELLHRCEQRRASGGSGLRLSAILWLNGGMFPERHRPRPVQRWLAGPLGPAVSRLITERAFVRGFSRIFGPQTRPDAVEMHRFWELLSYRDGHHAMGRTIRYMAERRRNRARWVEPLARTACLMRLVNGVADPVSGGDMADRYAEVVPQADVRRLAGIGHYPQLEAPEAVITAARELFSRVDGES
ncbi:MAG TPA: alpha/beta hydrolase [Gammaproteobacteria bacterium]|nr:alpha/beta hydrolase [Gammaproteobacteria bacterium]